ncbi:YfiR/HmsC family protein [Putridiphycobacter roseus]|uniref:YfiR/HmsC family protein n=1 Tax=Putridiphycobacter roseus TaxID=2219161 RepID=UPI00131449A8|nr:YfiR/HmsC family protein [Putridiphycobacter roseus]
MKKNYWLNSRFLLLISLLFFSISSFSKVTEENIKLKVDFIVETIKSTSLVANSSPSYFQIGVVGRGSEIRKIKAQLDNIFQGVKIQDKPVKVVSFSRIKSIANVDFVIISGETKIKPNELKAIIGNTDYILLTENLPFGSSELNYAVTPNDKIIYQVNEKALKKKGVKIKSQYLKGENRVYNQKDWLIELGEAQRIIRSQVKTIKQKKNIIKSTNVTIGKNKKVINAQNKDLVIKDSTINSQRNWLILAITSIILISSLSLLLLRSNKLRKVAIIEVERKNKEILDSLNYAKNIQKAILPNDKELTYIFDHHFILFEPKDIVSGDFYWQEDNQGLSFFAVADCTGHGVPGALMSVICSRLLTKIVKEYQISNPAKILDLAVKELAIHFSKSDVIVNDGMDLSLICIDKKSDRLYFSGANNHAYYFSKGVLHTLKADKQPIGTYDQRKPYTRSEVVLSEMESIYLFSDGYPDQFGGERNKKFSRKRFRNMLMTVQYKKVEEQQRIIKDTLSEWKLKEEQIDDICVAGIIFK